MEKPNVTIRYALPNDNLLLAEMGARTFYDTFAADNTPENMAAFLADTYSAEKQAAELANPAFVSLIAEVEGVPVGYATLRTGKSAEGITGVRPLELGRLYTEREWIGYGVGAALMRACLEEAERRGHDTLWLGVWERNPRALAFYQKWGFVQVGKAVFVVGDDPQTDFILERVVKTPTSR